MRSSISYEHHFHYNKNQRHEIRHNLTSRRYCGGGPKQSATPTRLAYHQSFPNTVRGARLKARVRAVWLKGRREDREDRRTTTTTTTVTAVAVAATATATTTMTTTTRTCNPPGGVGSSLMSLGRE
ncbi:hypothetical protein PUN28_003197 [Cardiocondyla obscurior]|uniref:Uncharacterized protein n=1 Tax=Cardiocondyla obscurior TaxID=286306 RepID=A0AAW2GJM7_9HYME